MEICRLKKEDYDELINLLNSVFARKNNKETDFEKDLPKMCVRDDYHMGQHLGIKEDGKLVAAIGIYPLPTVIGGEELMFSTVGNIATHWDYAGKGYMTALINAAMEELEKMGAVASRLGGLRQRYARYGYESCGVNFVFTLTPHNIHSCMAGAGENVQFIKIEKSDEESIAFAKSLYEKGSIYLKRDGDDMYNCMVAWQNIPYLAVQNGEKIGYLCVNQAQDGISESFAINDTKFADMLAAWQKRVDKPVVFRLMAYELDKIRQYSRICENIACGTASHFKMIHFDKVANALIKLKRSYMKLNDGSCVLDIKDYGKIKLYVDGENAGCEKTDETADITLTKADATRFLFGPFPPYCASETPSVALGWLPLPLSWNLQNRV